VLLVVRNGFHHVGDQLLPLWQPVIATTDNRTNAPRAIELRIFMSFEMDKKPVPPARRLPCLWSASKSSSLRIDNSSNEILSSSYIELERLSGSFLFCGIWDLYRLVR